MSRDTFSAVIIGGGPAGAAAARVLAKANVDVLLVDAEPAQAFRVGESLVPAARNILTELGVWERFQADGHLPCYGNMSAWGSPHLTDADFIRSPYGHGWHLDRQRFDTLLRQQAAEAGASVWTSSKLLMVEWKSGTWQLLVKRRGVLQQVTCSWLLDCTGRSRRVVRDLGIEADDEDTLLAFYARFRPDPAAEEDQDSRTVVESASHGWFHTALLPSSERIVTLFTDAGSPWIAAAKTSAGFTALVQATTHIAQKLEAYGYAIGEQPQARDARSSRLDRFHGEGWLAAGDSAMSFDPLSSQGILSALYSGIKAGHAVAGHLGGDGAALARYDDLLMRVYDSFLANRHEYYSYERRWTDNAFWQARLNIQPH